MRKLTAIILALCLALSLSAALADSGLTVTVDRFGKTKVEDGR